jgi:tRNA modification GTPase
MTLDLDATICAIASAPGGALRGVLRISGPQTIRIVQQVFVPSDGQPLTGLTSPTTLAGHLRLPRLLGDVPTRLYLWPTARSYTRQPAAELHLIGSPPVLEAALETVCQAGARLAGPGEFTLRAFLAGRLDLTQAEAVLGVIDARGGTELQIALAQLAGGLAGSLAALRERLLDLLAHLEAGLDFVDEDIEFISARALDERLAAAADEVAAIAAKMAARGQAGELPRVVLVGEPNAGKSSLFNALVDRQAAIVSPAAGTTRDFVSCTLTLAGGECLLIDTAGVQRVEGSGPVAAAAQSATRQQVEQADATILCVDATRGPTAWERERQAADVPAQIAVWTKCDGVSVAAAETTLRTSSRTGAGLDELKQRLDSLLASRRGEAGAVASTWARCRESLELAAAALDHARSSAASGRGEELIAAEVRAALDAIGQVVGAVYTEDVLDRVFSRFCIGK